MACTTPLSPVKDPSSGAKLKARMRETGTTVAELSERTGISTRTITALRSGASAGNFATWCAIARAMRCGIEEVAG